VRHCHQFLPHYATSIFPFIIRSSGDVIHDELNITPVTLLPFRCSFPGVRSDDVRKAFPLGWTTNRGLYSIRCASFPGLAEKTLDLGLKLLPYLIRCLLIHVHYPLHFFLSKDGRLFQTKRRSRTSGLLPSPEQIATIFAVCLWNNSLRFSERSFFDYENGTANSLPIAEGKSESWIHPLITAD
jgi:hypothetical protein